MDARRVTAAAGAVGIHALVGIAMLGLFASGHPPRPVRPDPVTARLVEPPPAPVPLPAPLPRPPEAARPEPPPAPSREARTPPPRPPTAPEPTPKASAPVREPQPPAPAAPVPAAEAPLAPSPRPPLSPAAPADPPPQPGGARPALAAAADAPATAAAPTGTTLASPAAAGPIGQAAAAQDAPRRVGPRVDASWTGNTPPPYPALSRRMGEQGEVRLDVHVGADGAVLDVQVRASSGSPALDRAAIDTVRRWRFRPATVDGQAVSEWYRDWKWVFRLEG
jgi:protein TonB